MRKNIKIHIFILLTDKRIKYIYSIVMGYE